MSIKPTTIKIKESNKKKENIYKTPGRVFINSKKYLKDNSKPNKLLFLQKKSTFWSSTLLFFKQSFAGMLQQRKSRYKSQSEVFESSMKFFIIIGKYLGLFPFLGNESKKRCPLLSWRYAFSFIIFLTQLIATILCLLLILRTTMSVKKFSYLSFYGTTCLSSLLVMRLARKWHELMRQVEAVNLNDYIDSYVIIKCKITTLIFFTFAVFDHVLSIIPKYLAVLNCPSSNNTVYEQYIMRSFPWFFEIGLPYALPFGILLSILNFIVAVNWSYSHVFVICVSLYLSSIIEQINKKMISLEGQHLSATYWRALRQDYNRATKLVRSFDEVINSIVFASFASNLFFVCLQIYYVLRNDSSARHTASLCPDHYPEGPYHVYEQMFVSTYFVYSSIFVIIRTFIVSTIAAKVHTASLKIAPVLYSVPSSTYGIEVQRFIDQIHGNTVALSGLNFFYVTKELVLSMVGTIVTYELVLLQFN